jgi:subtilisin-like proprotein convertase family protein
MIQRAILFSAALSLVASRSFAQYYYNQAAAFNGVSSYISVPNNTELNPTRALTIELWVFPTSYGGPAGCGLVSKNPTTSYHLGLDATGRVIFYPGVGQFDYLYSRGRTLIPLNTWTHIAATYDGTTTRIIINGGEDTSTTAFSGLIRTNGDSLLIGSDWIGDRFQGYIDEVRMWSVARPAPMPFGGGDRFIPLAIFNPDSTGQYAGFLNAWRLNGSQIDEGGFQSNNAFLHNITFWDLRQKPVNYIDYNCTLLLDGSPGCYCIAAPNAAFDATTGITLEAWVKRNSNLQGSTFGTIVAKASASTWNYGLFVSDDTLGGRVYFATNFGDTITTAQKVPWNVWTHIAATYNSTTQSAVIYVNGDSVVGHVFRGGGLIPNDPDSLFVGGFHIGGNTYQFIGQLDQVRIWRNVVRTQDEIRANMYRSIDFATIPTPGSSLTVYGFDGRNVNDMSQYQALPQLNFRGTARMTSAHRQVYNESTAPVLRDDPGGFPTSYSVSRHQFSIPDNDPSGATDSMYIPSRAPVSLFKVFLLLNHTFIGDLVVTLTSPTGVSVDLLTRGGNLRFQQDLMTVFSDAADSVAGGQYSGFQSPYSPFLKPSNPMTSFIGLSPQGLWKLKVTDFAAGAVGTVDGWGMLISPFVGVSESAELPNRFALEQNFPNPFNPTTTIRFSLSKEESLNLSVFNVLGQLVTTLVNERMKPGSYSIELNAFQHASGTYFYRIATPDFVATKKMMVLK